MTTCLRHSIVVLLFMGIVCPHAAASEQITVWPSGDTTGQVDYLNIQSAMESIGPGGKVTLAEGHFYINAGIVIEGFNGTLEGAVRGKKLRTTIEAVAPFSYTHATNYVPWNPVFPSMFFFEFPENNVEVKDLILQALAPAYVEARWVYGINTTALMHLIADFGGDVDVTYENLELIAAEGDYYFGSNVVMGIHSMRGPTCAMPCIRNGDSSLHGAGHAVFKEIVASNIGDYTLAAMWYRDGTMRIEDISSDSSVAPWGLINMETAISNVYSAESWNAIWLGYATDGSTTVRDVLADGGWCPAIFIRNSENVDLRDSQISGCDGFGAGWRSAFYVRNDNRNVTIADNVFTDIRGVPSAIWVRPNLNNTEITIRDNYYDPRVFTGPPGPWAVNLGGDNSLVVEESLTPEQVLDVGENNILRLGD